MTEAFVHPNLEKIPNPPPSRLEGSGGGGGGGGISINLLRERETREQERFQRKKKRRKKIGGKLTLPSAHPQTLSLDSHTPPQPYDFPLPPPSY